MKRMNIVHQVTKKYMLQNKKRTFITWLGILFMVILMTCVFVGKDTAIMYLQDVAESNEGKWHMTVYNMTKEDVEQLEKKDYIVKIAASVHMGFMDFNRSKNEERPYINLKCYESDAIDWNNIMAVEGRLPENDSEIILSNACKTDGSDICIGDQIPAKMFDRKLKSIAGGETTFPYYNVTIPKGETIDAPEQFPVIAENADFVEEKAYTGVEKTYTVVGFTNPPQFEQEGEGSYTAYTLCSQEDLKQAKTYNIFVQMDESKLSDKIYSELDDLLANHSYKMNDMVLAFSAHSMSGTLNTMTIFMTVFFLVLIVITSVILIYNVFDLSYRERCMYLGMLSSVGATPGQKRSSIYYEAFSILIVALPMGVLLGFGVVLLGMKMLSGYIVQFMSIEGSIKSIPVTLYVNVPAVLLILIFSVVTVLVSAYLPARKVGKIGAVESIRGNETHHKKGYKMHKISFLGAEGMLSKNFLTRNKRSKRGICRAIAIVLVIFFVTSYGSQIVHTIIDYKVGNIQGCIPVIAENEKTFSYESPDGRVDDNEYLEEDEYQKFLDELNADSNVVNLRQWYNNMLSVQPDASFWGEEYKNAVREIAKEYQNSIDQKDEADDYLSDRCLDILIPDDDTLKEIAEECDLDQSVLFDSEQPSCIVLNSCNMSTDTLRFGKKAKDYKVFELSKITDLQEGDSFKAHSYSVEGDKTYSLTVAGVVQKEQLNDYLNVYGDVACVLMSKNAMDKVAKLNGYSSVTDISIITGVFGCLKEDESLFHKLKALTDHYDNFYYMDVDYKETAKSFAQNISDMINVTLVCFVILTSFICLLNLIASIGGKIAMRKKEFAIMQSIGMERRQILKMVVYEILGMLLEGTVWGLAIAIFLILGIHRAMSSIFGLIPLVIPFGRFALALIMTLVVVVVIAVIFYKKQGAENILENIRNESI